jgi:hypothetical protein
MRSMFVNGLVERVSSPECFRDAARTYGVIRFPQNVGQVNRGRFLLEEVM